VSCKNTDSGATFSIGQLPLRLGKISWWLIDEGTMKHHKQFRIALSVSVQERREQYSEMTDADVAKALKALAEQIQKGVYDRRRAEQLQAWRAHPELTPASAAAELAEIRRRKALADHWHRGEQERLARLTEEELRRQQERDAQRELSLRMIDLGYKALAKELHPDKGGSSEAMARLNRARAHTKTMS
jgi:hypothetical protein